jgi:2Fe-2S ferredoxin
MGGTNPYIKPAEFVEATRPYTVTFLPEGKVFKVDPADIPYDRTGLPGSILDIAAAAGIHIDHACGGVCACSTCHVYVREGLESCNEANDDEFDQLDNARGIELTSRLACQCVPNGSKNIVVEIPGWNRNAVSEHDH